MEEETIMKIAFEGESFSFYAGISYFVARFSPCFVYRFFFHPLFQLKRQLLNEQKSMENHKHVLFYGKACRMKLT